MQNYRPFSPISVTQFDLEEEPIQSLPSSIITPNLGALLFSAPRIIQVIPRSAIVNEQKNEGTIPLVPRNAAANEQNDDGSLSLLSRLRR